TDPKRTKSTFGGFRRFLWKSGRCLVLRISMSVSALKACFHGYFYNFKGPTFTPEPSDERFIYQLQHKTQNKTQAKNSMIPETNKAKDPNPRFKSSRGSKPSKLRREMKSQSEKSESEAQREKRESTMQQNRTEAGLQAALLMK
ncbi:auxin efflux carrier component 4, partial [Corchorus capsularis]